MWAGLATVITDHGRTPNGPPRITGHFSGNAVLRPEGNHLTHPVQGIGGLSEGLDATSPFDFLGSKGLVRPGLRMGYGSIAQLHTMGWVMVPPKTSLDPSLP